MTLGQKLTKLRLLEGTARGLGRELTQSEVAAAIRDEMGGKLSQSYLSQLESGARPNLTSATRLLLARFFHVHPGYLVDDPAVHLPIKLRRDVDDQIDLWLIEGAELFRHDTALCEALLAIAKHEQSRACLILLGSMAGNRQLIDRLVAQLSPSPSPRRRRRGATPEEA
jgi:transcriptional regulator with XRE-family HTH domain